MSVVRINAITVPAEGGEEVARRFAARAGTVDGAAGFEGFQLLRPTDDRTTWLVVTRWQDEAAFLAWRNDPSFMAAHARPEGGPGHGDGAPAHPPVAMTAELWSFDLALEAGPRGGVSLRDAHVAGAWIVIVANGLTGLWALGAHWLPRLRSRVLWWATAAGEVAIFGQVGLGVASMKVDDLEPQPFHEFYGFVALFTVAILYAYKAQLRDRLYLLYGLGGLFLMGLGLRAFYLA